MSKYTRRGKALAMIPSSTKEAVARATGSREMTRKQAEALARDPQRRQQLEERDRLISLVVKAAEGFHRKQKEQRRRENKARGSRSHQHDFIAEERFCRVLAVERFWCGQSGQKFSAPLGAWKRLIRFERAHPEWMTELIGRLIEIQAQRASGPRRQ